MNRHLAAVWKQIAGMTVIMHKAPHDILILAELFGVSMEQLLDHIGGFEDTMTAAYVLRTLPKGLKPLELRLCGMASESYLDVVRDADEELARAYLERLITAYPCAWCPDSLGFEVVEPLSARGKKLQPRLEKCSMCNGDGTSWPTPDEQVEYKNGEARIKRGWGIGRRIRTALKKGTERGLRDWWEGVDEGYRLKIEAVAGSIPPVTLSDVQPQSRAIRYSARDSDATIRVYPKLMEMLDAEGQRGVYEINRDALPLITRMMDVGVRVDVDHLRRVSGRLENDNDIILYKLEQSLGWYINPGSRDQVADLLFGEYGLPVVEWTDGDKESTKDKVLEDLKLQVAAWPEGREGSRKQAKILFELGLITDHRERTKLNSMAMNLVNHTDKDGRIHCQFNEAVTDTNRLSSSQPNLQNIPTRTELGTLLRAAFVAPDGYELVGLDYSQIEVRIMAHESREPNLIQILRDGVDVHLGTASLVFEKARELIEAWERRAAKTITFLILYGGGAKRLRAELKLSGIDVDEETAQDYINALLKRAYPGIQEYMWDKQAEARRVGYVEDMWGWRKYLPSVHSEIVSVRREAERMATNAPIQSGAAGVMKRACPGVYDAIKRSRKRGYDADPLLTVHDEFVGQVRKGGGERLKMEMEEAMVKAATLVVPIVVDGKIGQRWSEIH